MRWGVTCRKCNVWIDERSAFPEGAAAAWNSRADLAPLAALAMQEAAQRVLQNDPTIDFVMDLRICCDGQDCGCQGATIQQYLEFQIRTLPIPSDADILAAALRVPEIAALVEGLQNIARQRTIREIPDDELPADIDLGYDECIAEARRTLAALESRP
jgi:hypothetical protein